MVKEEVVPPESLSGIYPRLAFYNNEGECGTGAVVPCQMDPTQNRQRCKGNRMVGIPIVIAKVANVELNTTRCKVYTSLILPTGY